MRTLSVFLLLSLLGLTTSLALDKSKAKVRDELYNTTPELGETPTAGSGDLYTTNIPVSQLPITGSNSPNTGSTASPQVAERECGCTRSKIWLDIVAVIDNSLTMTQAGIAQVSVLSSNYEKKKISDPS